MPIIVDSAVPESKTATTKTCELKSKLQRVSKLKKWEIWFLDFHVRRWMLAQIRIRSAPWLSEKKDANHWRINASGIPADEYQPTMILQENISKHTMKQATMK